MEQADAVFSHVRLEPGRGAIATGPNMSGKSTLMRALGGLPLVVLGGCSRQPPSYYCNQSLHLDSTINIHQQTSSDYLKRQTM